MRDLGTMRATNIRDAVAECETRGMPLPFDGDVLAAWANDVFDLPMVPAYVTETKRWVRDVVVFAPGPRGAYSQDENNAVYRWVERDTQDGETASERNARKAHGDFVLRLARRREEAIKWLAENKRA